MREKLEREGRRSWNPGGKLFIGCILLLLDRKSVV